MGNELRGDDAAGILVARELLRQTDDGRPTTDDGRRTTDDGQSSIQNPKSSIVNRQSSILVLDAGAAPENVTGALRRFRPDLVVFVDAADMGEGEAPGAVRWLDWRETDGLSASTHTLPLHVISQYLVSELHCDVALIGIQPGGTAFDHAASPAVRQAAADVASGLWAIFSAIKP